jgi:uncharacterized protein
MLMALLGGVLIGLAAAIALIANGRIAGISGILGKALDPDDGRGFRDAFLEGLIGMGIVIGATFPHLIGRPTGNIEQLALAGLLVGMGTTLANGCTSGHGVCGIARLSKRSFVAVGTFMATAMLTVFLVGSAT